MGTQTKIVVIKAKEIIYTGIFLVLGILLIVLLMNMFGGNGNKKAETESQIRHPDAEKEHTGLFDKKEEKAEESESAAPETETKKTDAMTEEAAGAGLTDILPTFYSIE